ncbi:hypothetical protein Misp05_21130 [Micromonospora sp. NBRC 107095]|nr:hypothetical protein Misp05_21130 [Micromonospora sp. NBRC 107095]
MVIDGSGADPGGGTLGLDDVIAAIATESLGGRYRTVVPHCPAPRTCRPACRRSFGGRPLRSKAPFGT